jgi:FkbM family methyltransferase
MGRFLQALAEKVRQSRRKNARPFATRMLDGTRLVGADIGGAHGLLEPWWTLHGSAFFYVFEPHPASFEATKAYYSKSQYPDLYRVLPVALSGTGGKRTLYCSNAPTGSSLHPPAIIPPGYTSPSYFFPCREIPIDTKTLRETLAEQNEPAIDLIKLDVEHAEMEILQGMAPEQRDRLLLVDMELDLFAQEWGIPDFGEVDKFFRGHGMELFDVRVGRNPLLLEDKTVGYHENVFGVSQSSPYISSRATAFDLVYFRKPGPLIEKKDKAALRKLAVCYCAYNFFSEAHQIADQGLKTGVFTESEALILKNSIVGWHRKLFYRFYHRSNVVFNSLRFILGQLRIGDYRRWIQYMWVCPPNA